MASPREDRGRRVPVARAWVILVAAGLLEIVWAIALKHADGFTSVWPSALAVTAALVSFVLLAVALRSLPVGTAYAVWVGIGAVGVVLAGVVALGEVVTLPRLVFLSLIVLGVAGLRMVDGRPEADNPAADKEAKAMV